MASNNLWQSWVYLAKIKNFKDEKETIAITKTTKNFWKTRPGTRVTFNFRLGLRLTFIFLFLAIAAIFMVFTHACNFLSINLKHCWISVASIKVRLDLDKVMTGFTVGFKTWPCLYFWYWISVSPDSHADFRSAINSFLGSSGGQTEIRLLLKLKP